MGVELLKSHITSRSRGHSFRDCLTKADLRNRAVEAMAASIVGSAAGPPSSSSAAPQDEEEEEEQYPSAEPFTAPGRGSPLGLSERTALRLRRQRAR